ncbi:hypothetical protein FQN50_001426 [Emmonsiellopsis sp. PD_5]|nr:hypothetical protein FQN50_001426 [Emmonsiellopsis sp. PD_5]
MHLVVHLMIVLVGYHNTFVLGAAVDDVFDVKKGTDHGGCDQYRTGEANAKLDVYFEEAVDLITTAAEAFDSYNSDQQVQKIAKGFFGISPNANRDGADGPEDEKLLEHVQGNDWLEQTTRVKNNKAYGGVVPELKNGLTLVYDKLGEYVAMYSSDLREYYFGPPYPTRPPTYCAKSNHIAVVTPMSTGKGTLTMTLCPEGFFRKKDAADAIIITNSHIGKKLQDLETKITPDIDAWGPDKNIEKLLESGNRNPDWPGKTDDFVNYGESAYTATHAILTAQKTNPRQPTESNPENYAWAALAVYLARNGEKMDYSTGLARPITDPLDGPAPDKRDNSKKRSHLDERFVSVSYTS